MTHSLWELADIATEHFNEKEALEKLESGQHKSPPKGYPTDKSEYADPEFYEFPLDTPKRVKAALAYFDKHKWHSPERKKEAAKRILAKAKKFDISVSKDTNVYKEAHA